MRVLWLFLFVMIISVPSFAQDGIPDNCENLRGQYYTASWFVRYEPQNGRVVLMDWNTGEVVRELQGGFSASTFYLTGWSASCRYVSVAIGESDDLDTVVYDVTNGARLGQIENAVGQAHHVTWGWNDYLVVETRNGAYLWNVPANTQLLLTTSFDPYSARNFNRLRWDGEHGLLTVNFAVGGRTTYNLQTGEETIAQAVNSYAEPIVNVGGKGYDCTRGGGVYNYYNDNDPYNVDETLRRRNFSSQNALTLRYDVNSRTIYLDTSIYGVESVVVLEGNIDIGSFSNLISYSYDCRYIAVILQQPDADVYDTVVYDIQEGRRVATFADAQLMPYQTNWSPNTHTMLVNTSDGAYLWHVLSDERLLITSAYTVPVSGRSRVINFQEQAWLNTGNRLLVIPLDNPSIAQEIDAQTGQVVDSYPVDSERYQAQFADRESYRYSAYVRPNFATGNIAVAGQVLSGTSGYASSYYSLYNVCEQLQAFYSDSLQAIVVQQNNIDLAILPTNGFAYDFLFSPNCRYMIASVSLEFLNTPYDSRTVDNSAGSMITLWDITTGQELQAFRNQITIPELRARYGVYFSPDGERAIIRSTAGYYLWDSTTNGAYLLVLSPYDYIRGGYLDFYWDYARGQVWMTGGRGVYGIDMLTGVQLSHFAGMYLQVDNSGNWLINTFEDIYKGSTIRIAHLSTGGEYLVRSETKVSNRCIHISPDGRYIVAFRHKIRVWDTTQLAENLEDRLPIAMYDGPEAEITTAVFVDGVTLEVVAGGETTYWNVETGEQVIR